MTATDELRRLLDGRGIEHMDFNMPERSLTLFAGDEHDGAYTENSVDTILTVYGASPEQAVEATLGRGTCRMVPTRDKPRSKAPTLTCSECGWWTDRINDEWRFCPSCGKRVKA